MLSWVSWRLGVIGLLMFNLFADVVISASVARVKTSKSKAAERPPPPPPRQEASKNDNKEKKNGILNNPWSKGIAATTLLTGGTLSFLLLTAGDRCLERSLRIFDNEILRDAGGYNQLLRNEKLGDPIRWPDSSQTLEKIIKGCEQQTGRRIDPDRPSNARWIMAGYHTCQKRCRLWTVDDVINIADAVPWEIKKACWQACEDKWQLPPEMYIGRQQRQQQPQPQQSSQGGEDPDGDYPTGEIDPLMMEKVQQTRTSLQNKFEDMVQRIPGKAEQMLASVAAAGGGMNLKAQGAKIIPALAKVGAGIPRARVIL
ncbi:MAG: hypothetical protein M1823_003535 [Watsoniomyces obsoletus]|nr:MAG: hypothetical protein M1823_003535 [Watsoniomyces obsoletus]